MIKYAKLKVLIIEDFAEFARAVGTMLRDMGFMETTIVTNGESAIQACRETKYDVILSDYNLGPQKDGQQVLEELVEFKLIKPSCTFIMITAEKTTAMVMGALELSPDSYLTKPFNSQLLKARIDRSIKKKQVFKPVYIGMQKKQWNETVALCDELFETHPKYKTHIQKYKFKCLCRMKDWEHALSLVQQITDTRPTPWSLKGIGDVYAAQNKLKEAEKIFSQLIQEFPYALEGYDSLAAIQRKLKKTFEAQKTLELAVAKSPKLIRRQTALGELAEENNDYAAMTQAYRHAIKYGKNSAFASPKEYVKFAKSIGRTLQGNTNEDRNKLIMEVEDAFQSLEKNFSDDCGVQFRGAVAHADFSSIISDNKAKEKYIKSANRHYDNLEEHIGAEESLEIAESLKQLGLEELAECVIEEAVEQYFDNPDFLILAAKITNNKHLIKNAKQASSLNNKAVREFKNNQFEIALDYFKQALEIAPNNVNIRLNQSQALLKLYQTKDKNSDHLYLSEEILSEITRLPITDSRYLRYSELMRLNQLMLQNIEK